MANLFFKTNRLYSNLEPLNFQIFHSYFNKNSFLLFVTFYANCISFLIHLQLSCNKPGIILHQKLIRRRKKNEKIIFSYRSDFS